MKWNRSAAMAVPVLFLVGASACGGERVPPRSLVDARADFVHVKDGLAMQLDPTDVHEADVALQRAEGAFARDPGDPKTDDLALIADRKALLADARAREIKAEQ